MTHNKSICKAIPIPDIWTTLRIICGSNKMQNAKNGRKKEKS